jgi:hypothetical protein
MGNSSLIHIIHGFCWLQTAFSMSNNWFSCSARLLSLNLNMKVRFSLSCHCFPRALNFDFSPNSRWNPNLNLIFCIVKFDSIGFNCNTPVLFKFLFPYFIRIYFFCYLFFWCCLDSIHGNHQYYRFGSLVYYTFLYYRNVLLTMVLPKGAIY